LGKGRVKILMPGDEPRLEAFLRPRLETSMFLLGNMRAAGLRDTGQAYGGTYAALLEGGSIVGVVAHYWNGNLVFQSSGCENILWRVAVRASRRPVGGLIGPGDQVAVAKKALGITGSDVQMDQKERLFFLNLEDMVVPEMLSSGRVRGRRSEPGDLDLLTAWGTAYSVEALGAQEGPELWAENRNSAVRFQREGRTWVLELEGAPVASSSFNTAIKEAVQVGGVWTPPEMRGRGYGRCVVAASLLDARREGVEQAILFTGEGNLAAQKAYRALGFRHIGDYRILLLFEISTDT